MAAILQNHFVLAVRDLKASARFFQDLGFRIAQEPDGWIFVSRDSTMVMLGECRDAIPPSALGDHSYFGYLRVDDADAFYEEVKASGARILSPIETKPWGMREFSVASPEGHRLTIGQWISGAAVSAAARALALLLLLLLPLAEAASQEYYPLEPGNSWRYAVWSDASPAGPGPETVTISVLADTVLPGGDRYGRLDALDPLGGARIHADADAVSYRSGWDSAASTVFDLTGSAGHAYALNWGPYFSAGITSIDTVMLFGRQTRRIHYRFDGLAVLEVTLAEGFGIVGALDWGDGCMFPCAEWQLVGCVIRDTVYGAVGVAEAPGLPSRMALTQNYPNPFNPSTTLSVIVPARGFVSLTVHDILGREVAALIRGELGPGSHRVTWDAADLPSGAYFFRYRSGSGTVTTKGLLAR